MNSKRINLARSFDQPPIYDPITKNGDMPSDIMQSWLSNFYETLVSYLTSTGIFIPRINTFQRNSINTPQNGMIIYNIDLDAPQIYQSGVWKTFTTV
jgi:hypothetical protein